MPCGSARHSEGQAIGRPSEVLEKNLLRLPSRAVLPERSQIEAPLGKASCHNPGVQRENVPLVRNEDVLQRRSESAGLFRLEVPCHPDQVPADRIVEFLSRDDDRQLCRRKLDFKGERAAAMVGSNVRPPSSIFTQKVFVDNDASLRCQRVAAKAFCDNGLYLSVKRAFLSPLKLPGADCVD